jgi:hypothetical protein
MPVVRLVVFEADLYDTANFTPAIAGCQCIFLDTTREATTSKVGRTETENRTLQFVQFPQRLVHNVDNLFD